MLDHLDKRQQPMQLDQAQFDRLATAIGQMHALRVLGLTVLEGEQQTIRRSDFEQVTTIDQLQKLFAIYPDTPDQMKQAMLQNQLDSIQRNAELIASLHACGVALIQREAQRQLEPSKPKPSFKDEFLKGLTGGLWEGSNRHEDSSSTGKKQ